MTSSLQTNSLLTLPDELIIKIYLYSNNNNLLLTNHYFYNYFKDERVRALHLISIYGKQVLFSSKNIHHPWLKDSEEMLLKLINLDVSLENEDYFIIQYCCKKGYTTAITYLFYQNTTYPSLNINYKNSLFFKLAIENSQLTLATLLIGLNIIYLPYINNLFINASSKQLLLSMDYLLSLGADINHENSRALREASYFNNLPSLEHLLTRGINVHAFNESSLLSACHKGYYKVVKLLIQYGSDINFNYGSSLRFSASSGHFKIVELLIKNNINLNSQYCGIKALRDSAKNGHLNIVRLLLENKVPINGLKDAPLLCAIIAGHYDVTLTLLEHGANVSSINSNLLTVTFKNQRKDIMGLLKRFGYQC